MNGCLIMRRSKLEIHVDILTGLARYGPLKLTNIMRKANVDADVLKQYLGFLIQHNLVKEETLLSTRHEKGVVYAITERGLTVLKYFRALNSALQTIKETKKIPPLPY